MDGRWTEAWMVIVGWMDELLGEWMDDGNGWMVGQLGEWVSGLLYGWKDDFMDDLVGIFLKPSTYKSKHFQKK